MRREHPQVARILFQKLEPVAADRLSVAQRIADGRKVVVPEIERGQPQLHGTCQRRTSHLQQMRHAPLVVLLVQLHPKLVVSPLPIRSVTAALRRQPNLGLVDKAQEVIEGQRCDGFILGNERVEHVLEAQCLAAARASVRLDPATAYRSSSWLPWLTASVQYLNSSSGRDMLSRLLLMPAGSR